MRGTAREQGCPEPAFTENGFFTAVFFPNPEIMAQIAVSTPEATPEVAPEVTGEVTGEVLRLLAAMEGEMKRREMQGVLGLKHEDHFREAYLLPALKIRGIEMTIPDKPRSSKQRYRITLRGERILEAVLGTRKRLRRLEAHTVNTRITIPARRRLGVSPSRNKIFYLGSVLE